MAPKGGPVPAATDLSDPSDGSSSPGTPLLPRRRRLSVTTPVRKKALPKKGNPTGSDKAAKVAVTSDTDSDSDVMARYRAVATKPRGVSSRREKAPLTPQAQAAKKTAAGKKATSTSKTGRAAASSDSNASSDEAPPVKRKAIPRDKSAPKPAAKPAAAAKRAERGAPVSALKRTAGAGEKRVKKSVVIDAMATSTRTYLPENPSNVWGTDRFDYAAAEAAEAEKILDARRRALAEQQAFLMGFDTKQLTAQELRAELWARGLPASGLKADLLLRLEQAISSPAGEAAHAAQKRPRREAASAPRAKRRVISRFDVFDEVFSDALSSSADEAPPRKAAKKTESSRKSAAAGAPHKQAMGRSKRAT